MCRLDVRLSHHCARTAMLGTEHRLTMAVIAILLLLLPTPLKSQQQVRPRARDIGVIVGILPSGRYNAITDVSGVMVGHTTIIRGNDIRTGVTAVLPHTGNLFQQKVPAAVFVGNAFGKLMGSTQVNELGELETPVLLTSTLSVPRVADALISYMLALPGNETVESINPVVAETNDGFLNDIRGRHISEQDVLAAIKDASAGPVAEGAVGAGTGTVAFGFKGGIGTASRRLPASLGGYTIGVLVQTNFGGVLTINGAPVGRELGRYYLHDDLSHTQTESSSVRGVRAESSDEDRSEFAGGSVIVVVATDAPLDSHNLLRFGARAMLGLGRTGSAGSNESGDYVIAFSTAPEVRIVNGGRGQRTRTVTLLTNQAMSPLFLAVIEATEEAVYNSLFRAQTMSGRGHVVEALPLEETEKILRKYGVIAAAPPD